MRPFTDDDVKRLKDVLTGRKSPLCIPSVRFRDLLARMEAAEDLMGIPIGSTTWNERHERWRTKAGK